MMPYKVGHYIACLQAEGYCLLKITTLHVVHTTEPNSYVDERPRPGVLVVPACLSCHQCLAR